MNLLTNSSSVHEIWLEQAHLGYPARPARRCAKGNVYYGSHLPVGNEYHEDLYSALLPPTRRIRLARIQMDGLRSDRFRRRLLHWLYHLRIYAMSAPVSILEYGQHVLATRKPGQMVRVSFNVCDLFQCLANTPVPGQGHIPGWNKRSSRGCRGLARESQRDSSRTNPLQEMRKRGRGSRDGSNHKHGTRYHCVHIANNTVLASPDIVQAKVCTHSHLRHRLLVSTISHVMAHPNF